MTWVPQSRLPFSQTPHIGWPSGLWPSTITILQCEACVWRQLAATIGNAGRLRVFFLLSSARCLIVRPYADTSKFSYTTTLSYPTLPVYKFERKKNIIIKKKYKHIRAPIRVWEPIQAHIQDWEHIRAHIWAHIQVLEHIQVLIQVWEHIQAHIQTLVCALFCPGSLCDILRESNLFDRNLIN